MTSDFRKRQTEIVDNLLKKISSIFLNLSMNKHKGQNWSRIFLIEKKMREEIFQVLFRIHHKVKEIFSS